MLDRTTRSYILFFTAGAAALLFGGILLRAAFFPPDTNPSHVFGCFESDNAGVIYASADGLRLDGMDGTLTVPFKLDRGKHGYALEVEGSISLVRHNDGFRWQRDPRGWSYIMPFQEVGAGSLDWESDPTKLDRFTVFLANGEAKVAFVRAIQASCVDD